MTRNSFQEDLNWQYHSFSEIPLPVIKFIILNININNKKHEPMPPSLVDLLEFIATTVFPEIFVAGVELSTPGCK